MSPFDLLTLFGGLAMFLYGMRLMGDGLRQGSSGTLKMVMEKVTNNPIKAFALGIGVTALIQSSTATIVITSGLVAAGILSLHQSLGIIVGANVGTTVTGQIIRLMDLDSSSTAWLQVFRPSTLAPIALIIGVILIMGPTFRNSKAFGNVAIGFGVLFSGLMSMTSAVSALTESGVFENMLIGLGGNHVIGYLTGVAVSFVLQSSSAAVGILQAFSASGLLTFNAVYPVIVGIYLGDCVTTAIVCSIGQKAEARRVGIVNILYNLSKSVLVFVAVGLLYRVGMLDGLWNKSVNSGIIANTNSIFNLCCAILLLPVIGGYEKLSAKIVHPDKVPENPYKDKLDALNPAFFRTPALALNACHQLLLTMLLNARSNLEIAFGLLFSFDEKLKQKVDEEEEYIDQMTDSVSKYMVELLPHLQETYQVGILDQYYKVVTDFERIGDHAVNVADSGAKLAAENAAFSPDAQAEIRVMKKLIDEILEDALAAFQNRDEEAAFAIEPLVELTEELISRLKMNHLGRMVTGECSVYADPCYMNLLTDIQRIADVCSNVGEATLVRANPQLANREHDYFNSLRSGRDETFNAQYRKAHEHYTELMNQEKIEALQKGAREKA